MSFVLRFMAVLTLACGLGACTGAGPEWADGVTVPTEPLQTTHELARPGWTYMGARISPQADFVVEARVLGVERYRRTATSDIIPYDVALGWQSMSNSQYLRELNIWQGQRRYYYQWGPGAKLQGAKMAAHSANMHMIPSSPEIFDMLRSVRPNDRVRITGSLVNVEIPGYGTLRTSMTRTDMWDGACEIIWVTDVQILPPPA